MRIIVLYTYEWKMWFFGWRTVATWMDEDMPAWRSWLRWLTFRTRRATKRGEVSGDFPPSEEATMFWVSDIELMYFYWCAQLPVNQIPANDRRPLTIVRETTSEEHNERQAPSHR